MTDILMPALSPTMEEGNLAKWHVKVGDKIESGQVIAEIETDKATMEVEAVDEGVVSEIVVPEGTEGVKVNALIARLDDGTGAKAAPAPAAAPAKAETAPAPAAAPAAAPQRQAVSLEQQGIPAGSYDLVPLTGMRKTIARRLTESFRDIPHFPLTIDLEIDKLLDARKRLNDTLGNDIRISVNDIVIRAAALALKKVPEANASFTPEGIALHKHADIAMAVAIDGGLITPIIRAAETKGLAQISNEAKDLAARARAGKLKPEEYQGGSFTVSNLGMFGIKSFASIINEPQGAILSVGAGDKRAVVKGDQIVAATVMTVTLTCDHRVVDGAIGARWLQAFKPLIEDPLTMLA